MLRIIFIKTILFFSLSITTNLLNAQVAINHDDSPPATNSIFTIKGAGGNYFYVQDSTGNVGINTLDPTSRLHVAGQIKLALPTPGTILDNLSLWSPTNGTFLKANTSQVASGPIVFAYENLVVNNSPGTIFQDDFVFGSDQLDHDGLPEHYSRFFLDKEKGAFRAGYVDNLRWNIDSLGNNSVGLGYNVLASGEVALAVGKNHRVTGARSHAFGNSNQALSSETLAFGHYTKANWPYAVTMGDSTGAERQSTFVSGKLSRATSNYAQAYGYGNLAASNYGLAIGKNNSTSNGGDLAMGIGNVTDGGTFAQGRGNLCSGSNSIAFGDSLTVIGYNSTAFGKHNYIGSYYSTTIGQRDTAAQYYGIALGEEAAALANYTIAIGTKVRAEVNHTTAIGNSAVAKRDYAQAIGNNVTAVSYAETVLGRYNTLYTPTSVFGWNANDRLFVIGNGTADTLRSNAMVILKNGLVGLGVDVPVSPLSIKGPETDSLNSTLEIQFSSSPEYRLRMDANKVDVDSSNLIINSISDQPVVIGTDVLATDHIFCVDGKVAVEEARTENKLAWPDYVFADNYKLPTADELKIFIDKNHHLPGIPKAEELEKDGLLLGAMQIKLLEKIEELTLLIIDMEKTISHLESLPDFEE